MEKRSTRASATTTATPLSGQDKQKEEERSATTNDTPKPLSGQYKQKEEELSATTNDTPKPLSGREKEEHDIDNYVIISTEMLWTRVQGLCWSNKYWNTCYLFWITLVLTFVFCVVMNSKFHTDAPSTKVFTREILRLPPLKNITNKFENYNTFLCRPFPLNFDRHDALFACDWKPVPPADCKVRLQASLFCTMETDKIIYKWVPVSSPPTAYRFQDDCLKKVIRGHCYDGYAIPRLAHFVWFGSREMPFYTFLAVLSSVRSIQPCLVLFHSDYLPFGPYWNTLIRLVPHILHVNQTPPSSIFGHAIQVVEHSADVARLVAVREFGGIYMDTDQVVLNPLDELRNYSVVMASAIPNTNYGNGMFMGRPGAEFLNLWYESYRTFNDNQWGFHSTIMPYQLHKQHPEIDLHIIHSFFRPYFALIEKEFYQEFYNWTSLHAIHLYVRLFPKYFQGNIEQQNSSLGQVTRYVMFGDRNRCFGNVNVSTPVRWRI